MSIDSSKLDEVLGAIKKAYGKESIQYGDEHSDLIRVPTGDIQLDYVLGGGVPLGRWVHAYGAQSTGKTLVSFKIISEAQKKGYTAAYYDVEKTFDPSWAEKIGVNTKELIVVEGATIESVGEKLEALLGVVNFHVIDSVAAAIPIGELEQDLEKWQQGLAARTWNKVIRKCNVRVQEENCIVLINQLRTVLGGRVATEEPSGGRLIRHESSVELKFKKSTWLYKDKNNNLSETGTKTDSVTGDVEPNGIEFQVRVEKSKVCVPYRSARMRLDFETGEFDQSWSLAMMASYFGLVERNGSWYTAPDGTRVQGESGLKTYIETNEVFAKSIREHVLGAI